MGQYTLSCYKQRIVVAIELANLRVEICRVLMFIGCSQYCLAALFSNLIQSITRGRNVTHDVIEKCVSLMCNQRSNTSELS